MRGARRPAGPPGATRNRTLRLYEASGRPSGEDARPSSGTEAETPAASPRPVPRFTPTCLAAGRMPPPPRLKLQPPEPQSPPQTNAESDFRAVALVTRAPPSRLCVHPATSSEATQRQYANIRFLLSRFFHLTESALQFSPKGLNDAPVVKLEKSPKETLLCTTSSIYRTYLP